MISIITVVLNGERFIEYAIQNVIDQACPEAEHIIVDGGSTDLTVDIVKSYAQRYSHIRWVSEKDEGQSDALNKGIAIARGDIIGILDYDDYYESNVLNKVSGIFRNLSEPSLLVGNTQFVDCEDKVTMVHKPSCFTLLGYLSGKDMAPFSASSYFYHKSLLQLIGPYDVDDHYSMDYDFLYRAVQVVRVKYVDETWANRRHLETTKTGQNIKTGQNLVVLKRLNEKYRKQLPLLQRCQVAILTTIYGGPFRVMFRAIDILISRPRDFFPRFNASLAKILNF
jgi:glycosyltransferase involved in cell wall biosynthesis